MPFMVRANILIEEIWVSVIDWDDQLPENILNKAKKWFLELQDLDSIKISKCFRRSTT